MRDIWIKIPSQDNIDHKKQLISKTVFFSSTYMMDTSLIVPSRKLGVKVTVSKSPEADIVLANTLKEIYKLKKENKKICKSIIIKSKEDEERVIAAVDAGADYIIAICPDWRVIPIENLIAKIQGRAKLLATVSNIQEAKLAFEILEIGVDGVVVANSDPSKIREIHDLVKRLDQNDQIREVSTSIKLAPAIITKIKPLGSGARGCIDTGDLLKEGEGLLVGCQSQGLFLIEGEVFKTPLVNSRPFRVNAGSIALYVMVPNGKTKYLTELEAGEEIAIIDRKGMSRTATITRVKIEWRPMLLIESEIEGRVIKTIIQNAETVRLVTQKGSRSVNDLTVGDEVLVYLEEGGRHFGVLVGKEKIIER